MDDQQLFVLTKRVKEALDLINALDENKLAVIVKRLVKNVGEKSASFTAQELEQLQDHLQLAEGQVATVLEGCAFFLERMMQSHARTFSGVWEAEAAGVLRRLRTISTGTFPTLESVDWRLHIQTASSGLTKLAEPRSILSLKLKRHDDTSEVVPLELSHEQMLTLLTQLDTAQQQIDALS